MKVSEMLAKPMQNGVRDGQRYRVVIYGHKGNGKSAIVDGMSAAVADGMSSYKLSDDSLYESFSCEALGRVLRREFGVKGSPSINTFYNSEYGEGTYERIVHQAGGIDFETYKNQPEDDTVCLRISFMNVHDVEMWEGWPRKWSVKIDDKRLQTEEMAQALQNLRNFHQRRQMRLLDEPSFVVQALEDHSI